MTSDEKRAAAVGVVLVLFMLGQRGKADRARQNPDAVSAELQAEWVKARAGLVRAATVDGWLLKGPLKAYVFDAIKANLGLDIEAATWQDAMRSGVWAPTDPGKLAWARAILDGRGGEHAEELANQ